MCSLVCMASQCSVGASSCFRVVLVPMGRSGDTSAPSGPGGFKLDLAKLQTKKEEVKVLTTGDIPVGTQCPVKKCTATKGQLDVTFPGKVIVWKIADCYCHVVHETQIQPRRAESWEDFSTSVVTTCHELCLAIWFCDVISPVRLGSLCRLLSYIVVPYIGICSCETASMTTSG